jgi:hypothetical protein
MSDIQNAERQYTTDPDDAADRAHVLEKIIGYERDLGHDTARLERVCGALYGETTPAERAAKQRRRAYARAKRAEEMRPFTDAIRDAYPEIEIRMDWSRKFGRKTIVRLAGVSFGPEYQSGERYGAGDPDDILPKLPEIIAGLKAQQAARAAVDEAIAAGKVRHQRGFVVVSVPESQANYDCRFGGAPLSLAYDSILGTRAAVESFLTTGEFHGRNAYGK